MIDSIDILFGQSGQSIYFDAPQGRPSSVASVTAWEDASGDTSSPESALSTGSIETVSLTFGAASGANEVDPKVVTLSAIAGLVRGRQYLATAASGESEWIEIARLELGTTSAVARTALLNVYASGDSFVSTRITAPVSDAWAADSSNLSDPMSPRPGYRAVFEYTVSGVVYRGVTYFDLVRYPFSHSVTPSDVDRLSRGWLSRLAEEDRVGQGEAIIKESAFQVKHDLWRRDLSDYAQRNSEVINELIRRKAVFIVVQAAYRHGAVARELVDYEAGEYQAYFEALIGESKTNQQVTADGGAAVVTPARILRR